MATGTAGERDDRDVPAYLRVTDEIPVDTPWRPEGVPPAARSPEATPSADTDTSARPGSATTADPPTEAEPHSPADASTEAAASATADRPTVTGAPVPADPPSGPFLEADSPSVSGPATAGAPVEAGGSQARATRPVPATDVQLRPVVPPPEPPPRPYAAPVTVEESIPVPPDGPYRPVTPPAGPVAPPAAGRRSLSRALWVGVIVAGAVLMGVGFLLVYGGFAGDSNRPAPCGGKPCAPPARGAAPPGAQIAYRTVERDVGYFEGTVTIANHGAQPMRSWTLSFRYPGADVHNTWDAVLQRRGEDAILTGRATARPIAPGATIEVRFGGSGTPSMPTDCRLNGAPCAFVAR